MNYDRFYNDDEDREVYDDGYGDSYDELEGHETIGYLNSQEIISVINADLAQKEMKLELLEKAIKIASSAWFWRFKSEEKKLDAIIRMYFALRELTEIE